jgi:AraC-like DNA-binding protein
VGARASSGSIERPRLPGATGAYEERLPSAPLRPHLACTWFNVFPADGAPIAVVPDGCIDLEWIAGDLRVAGPDREVKCELQRPGVAVIGFRFRPGAASSWLRVPASEIVGARLPLEAFWGAEARRIAEWAGRATQPAAIACRLEAALARRAGAIRPPDPEAACIRRSVERAPLQTDIIRQLCAELRVSERTLRRRCYEMFGYGPKTLQRIVRFQRFLTLARGASAGFAALASASGYTDQAHLTREARRMAALSPAAIREQLERELAVLFKTPERLDRSLDAGTGGADETPHQAIWQARE